MLFLATFPVRPLVRQPVASWGQRQLRPNVSEKYTTVEPSLLALLRPVKSVGRSWMEAGQRLKKNCREADAMAHALLGESGLQ